MLVLKLLETIQHLEEMNRAELSAIERNLKGNAKKLFGLDFSFSNHAVKDRFVDGDRACVTGIDAHKTLMWGFKHPKFVSIVDEIKNDASEEAFKDVRFANEFNNLNIVLSVSKQGIKVVTGDTKRNWENSKSYRGDAIIKVPHGAWTSEEFEAERAKHRQTRKNT